MTSKEFQGGCQKYREDIEEGIQVVPCCDECHNEWSYGAIIPLEVETHLGFYLICCALWDINRVKRSDNDN